MKTDAEIQQDVKDELKWEPMLYATEIGVSVKNGLVTLIGCVNTYAKKFAAESAAWRVKGVVAVSEELEVIIPAESKVSDVEIGENIMRTLKWNTLIPDEEIKIKVTDGWVYLLGQVDWNYEKESVIGAIRQLKGVRGVSNLIMVKPSINALLIRESICKALSRNAGLESWDTIDVETAGNKVILKGTTKSWTERRAVERAAWSAPGVAAVDDQLVIGYN